MRVGLIGYPVSHSISPVFQQAAFDGLGLPVRYELWEIAPENLATAVVRLRQPDVLGANVTIPHKQTIVHLLDRVDSTALAIGAVNTVCRGSAGELTGFNTDAEGFARALTDDGGVAIAGKRFVLLGSGGAARAAAAAVLAGGAASLVVCARRPEQAAAMVGSLRQAGLGDGRTETLALPITEATGRREQAIRCCDVLVNATPVGMAERRSPGNRVADLVASHEGEASSEPSAGGDGTPSDKDGARSEPHLLVDPSWLSASLLVFDLIYNPPLTPLLATARARGARWLNGLAMLVYQGAASFRLWTGRDPPVALMRQKAEEALGG